MMTRKVLFTLLATCFAFGAMAQKGNNDGYQIDVKLKNGTDSACYLAYYYGSKKYVKDTADVVKGNHFVFRGNKPLASGIYIIYFPDKINFEVLVNSENFTVTLDKNAMMEKGGMEFKNSVENSMFYEYLNVASEIAQEVKPYQQGLERATKSNNKDSINYYREKLTEADQRLKDYRNTIIKEHPNKLIARNFKALQDPEIPENPNPKDSSYAYRYMKKHYWDNIDFSDSSVLRTPIYESKLERYFDKMLLQIPDSLKKECDYIVNKAKANKEMFQFTVITLTNKYGQSKIMGLDEVFVHMIDNYYSDGQAFWLDSAGLLRLQDRAKTLKYTLIGNTAPNLTMKDTSDQYRVLHNECYADYNIVIFWDPDCGHCKKEVPKWDKEYERLKSDYSIRMIGITTTTLKKKWVKFIREKEIDDWMHLYDPDYQSPFRQLYDITSTPKVFVIDKNKKLIAKQLGHDQIEGFMKRMEKQKQLQNKQ